MVFSTHLKRIVRILIYGLIGIHIGLFVLLNIPSVQGKLGVWVSSALKNVLNTEVTVGHVEVSLFNRIHIEDVLLHDQEGEKMLNVDRLTARFELDALFRGKIVVNSIQLIGFDINLRKQTPQSVPNFQFVLDAFASKDTLNKSPDLDLRINSILMNQGKVAYHVMSEPETPGVFNASHISVDHLSASVSLKAFRNDTLHAIIKRLGFEEQSGFQLKKIGMKLVADNKHLNVTDFTIDLPSSSLKLDEVDVRFEKLTNLLEMTEDVHYKGLFNGSLVLKDFAPLAQVLKGLKESLDFSLAFNGQGKNLELPVISLYDDKYMRLNGKVSIRDWNQSDKMYLQTILRNFSLTKHGIGYFMNNLTGAVPPILQRAEFINFDGTATGYLNNLQVEGLLQTAAGALNADMLVHVDEKENRNYSGHLNSSDLNLGVLLGDPKLGRSNFNVELRGFNYRNKYPESYIKGVISSLNYSDYEYQNIVLDGIYKNGGFNGHLSLDDENAMIQLDGTFNTVQSVPHFNIQTSIRNFRPHALHLSDKYVDSSISMNLVADFTGKTIDDLNGLIRLDSISMHTSDSLVYSLDNLELTAGQVGTHKEIRVVSPFLNASVVGDYSYQNLPTGVMHILQKYLPSLLGSIKTDSNLMDNNFKFDFHLSDAEFFNKLFYVPLTMTMPASLKGFVNERSERLYVEGSFPDFIYDGTQYESISLTCDNPLEQFVCQVRGTMLMKSGAKLNVSLNTEATKDRIKTTLNWGNNTDITYGGQVAASTRFSRTEGENSYLQAEVEFLPTNIILNDTIWHIRSSHVSVDSGRVFIDNFLFERPGQHLLVDGKITKEESDSCIIDLKNIDVQYVLDILQFEAIEFGGMATGRVLLKNVLDKPDMRTRLDVQRFTVNDGLMGNADIQGYWDNELPGIRLDALMKEENLSSTHVTGFVSPKLAALDLMIEADSTNLDLLEPYFEGIFSELNARANGNVRLFGGFKTLDFEGSASVMLDTKVDVLNTYIQLRNDSVYLRPGEFSLNNARIFDREGHTGQVTGYLRHTHLKNLLYQFDISGNDLLMYNSDDPGDMLFYGKVYGTGNITLDGGNNAMNVRANLTTGPNTTFTYVTGLTTEAASNQFITFVDKTPKRVQDNLVTDFYHYTDALKKKENDGPPMDLHINMFIDATPNANMKIVMDPVSGDHIAARGTGNFQVSYYNKGDFQMFGNYIIDSGMYKLSMQEVIRKDFALQSGSTVTFAGDPYQANLDVQAVHTVNSVSLSDLTTDASSNQSTVKVNCLMNLTGSLANPSIKFDLELPTISEEDRELVRSATSTEEQMNTQIIYLLTIGKFYAYNYNENTNQSNATSSLAFNTLSGQLNNMLSQVMENKNWNIGANFSTGQNGWNDVEAEAILSGRLLNNRLLINGNFGYRENVMTNTNFIGDFEAIWLLTKNGEFRLRGYNQTNDRYFTKSTLTTQGIGFIYKKDFNKWNDLFKWLIRRQNPNSSK